MVADLAPPVFVHRPPRWKCPLGFLQSPGSLNTIKDALHGIDESPLSPLEDWAAAEKILQREATRHHKEITVKPPTSTLALLLSSTRDQVCQQGWHYLRSQGMAPSTQAQAYTMLVQCYKREEQDRMGLHQLGELKGLLARADINEESYKQRRKQVDRLMLNLKKAKQVAWIRNKHGSFVTDPTWVAKALSDHCSGISKEGGGTPKQCEAYMQSLPIPALFKPLSIDLVQEALRRQVPGASPGIDGFALNIYQEFHEFFSAPMLEILGQAQGDGLFPEA